MKVKLGILLPFLMTIFYFPLNNHKQKDRGDETALKAAEEARKARMEWVENKYYTLTLEEKIGQLFNIRAHSNLGAEHIAQVKEAITKYKVGGLTFFQGTPEKQAELTNTYQALSKKVPLMIAMDAEWGLGMRLKKKSISFPKQLTLGAIQNNHLLYDMGKEVAWQLRRLGVHVNFAPVVDVNNNPNNPVINTRSFGEDKYNVAAKGYMYMKGMEDNMVLSCAKHFPGHGDTDVDSHYDLPQILHDSVRLENIELFPFKLLSQHGVGSMMVAHLFIPTFDNTANRPSTLSKKTVTGILKDKIGYDGLLFTDGLGMKGVTKHHQPGKLEVEALKAGNDILLLPENLPAAAKEIKAAILAGDLDSTQVFNSVKKILDAKYRLGLYNYQPIQVKDIKRELNHAGAKRLKKKLYENALTLVRNADGLVPFKDLSNTKIASLTIGKTARTAFQKRLGKYASIAFYNSGSEPATNLISQLKKYDTVIVDIQGLSNSPSKGFGIKQSMITFLENLQKETKVILTLFGNPYSLKYFDNIENVLMAFDEDDDILLQEAAAEGLFGVFGLNGKLPVTASDKSQFGDGIMTTALQRLRYDRPENVGMNKDSIAKIETIAQEAINIKATPGCVVLVAKDNKVVFNKGFGYHTYAKKKAMKNDAVFDLASVTKIAATTLAIMKLYDEGKIDIYGTIGQYLPAAKGSNKENLIIKDVMAHHAGLKAWIPFYKETITKSKRNPRPLTKLYKKTKTKDFSMQVTDKLYMKNAYVDEIWKQIFESELRSTNAYKYSDLGFYMLAEIVKEITGQTIDEYTRKHFYLPMGLTTMTYRPLDRLSKTKIVPTENDNYFRRQRVQGTVHDMGAAMLDGLSGHAGLFGTANDLAVIMQMLLNKGYYGGKQYIRPETVALFTSRYPSSSRRGIGFDMREMDSFKSQNVSQKASYSTFGHLGFTGISAWADPDHNLIYLFLSNRTYPSMNNFKLNKKDIRPRIQETIYNAIGS